MSIFLEDFLFYRFHKTFVHTISILIIPFSLIECRDHISIHGRIMIWSSWIFFRSIEILIAIVLDTSLWCERRIINIEYILSIYFLIFQKSYIIIRLIALHRTMSTNIKDSIFVRSSYHYIGRNWGDPFGSICSK